MTLGIKCDKGHSWTSSDIRFPPLPEGTPACPICRRDWYRERDAVPLWNAMEEADLKRHDEAAEQPAKCTLVVEIEYNPVLAARDWLTPYMVMKAIRSCWPASGATALIHKPKPARESTPSPEKPEKQTSLQYILEPLNDHGRKHLQNVAQRLKQSNGEGWAVGEMLRRAMEVCRWSCDARGAALEHDEKGH